MKIEVLVSTMESNRSLIEEMNIQSDAVVVNQTNTDTMSFIERKSGLIKWIDVNEKGLSKSRNMALKNATGDIVLLADDDLEYFDNYKETITDAFKKYSEYDAICFQVIGKNKKFKDYKNTSKDISYLSSMKISSVEIAFKRREILNNDISFNEMFGSGSKYYMGEENIILFEMLRKGLKIKYVPIPIANLTIGNSSWFEGYTEKYFISTGAKFTEMSKTFSLLLILQFCLRKYSLYKDESTIFQALNNMMKGRREILNYSRELKKNKKIKK